MIVYIIGMPGCGKSKTAKYLQIEKKLNMIDVDKFIEDEEEKEIPVIIETYGIDYFRKLETKALSHISGKYDDIIVSCGGGVVTVSENKDIMKNGKVVFLNASIDVLKEHLSSSSNTRPLLKTKTIEELYKERIDLYFDFADYVIDYKDYISAANRIIDIMTKKKILVINGPNLNMLGLRDPNLYGSMTLEKINSLIEQEDEFIYEFFQSNHEGAIVDKIQQYQKYDAIIINPAAYTHTSVAIHDALEIVDIPKIEVHLSAVDSREDFRKINLVRDVVDKTFQGEKEKSYLRAVDYLKLLFKVI